MGEQKSPDRTQIVPDGPLDPDVYKALVDLAASFDFPGAERHPGDNIRDALGAIAWLTAERDFLMARWRDEMQPKAVNDLDDDDFDEDAED